MAVTVRHLAGYAAIAGTLPYLALKLVWLTGHPVGVTDPAFAADPAVHLLNLATAGMDLVAVVVALAFVRPWGERLPAVLVLLPTWVGTGFLAPIALAAPLLFGGETGALPLEPWVRPLVYGGFAWQGVTLLIAFGCYGKARWPWFFTATGGPGTGGALTARVGAVLGVFVAVVRLASGDVLLGVLALVGVVGVSTIVERWRPGGLLWPPAVAGWLGTGALFCWGAWGVVNTVGQTFLVAVADPVGTAADVAGVLGAVLLGYGGTRSADLRSTRYAARPALP